VVFVRLTNPVTKNLHVADIGLHKIQDYFDGAALARAVGADEPQDFPGFDCEAQVLHRGFASVGFVQMTDGNRCHKLVLQFGVRDLKISVYRSRDGVNPESGRAGIKPGT
jgi:hypothetical protein